MFLSPVFAHCGFPISRIVSQKTAFLVFFFSENRLSVPKIFETTAKILYIVFQLSAALEVKKSVHRFNEFGANFERRKFLSRHVASSKNSLFVKCFSVSFFRNFC